MCILSDLLSREKPRQKKLSNFEKLQLLNDKDLQLYTRHFLYAQMVLVSTFFQMFIVLGRYNIEFTLSFYDDMMPETDISRTDKSTVRAPL